MSDTRLVLFTMIYCTYIDPDRMVFSKSQINSISVQYSKWLSENQNLTGYNIVEESMIKFIGSECFL